MQEIDDSNCSVGNPVLAKGYAITEACYQLAMQREQLLHAKLRETVARAESAEKACAEMRDALKISAEYIRPHQRLTRPTTNRAGQGAWVVERHTMKQYYYKVASCSAVNADAPNCICWHDEETGPLKDAPTFIVRWRNRMTQQEKRIKIAESCGWTPYSPGDFNPTPRWINAVHEVRTLDGFLGTDEYQTIMPLPDYFSSLDACHEMIMAQPVSVRISVNYRLSQMLRENDAYFLDRCINSTAAERAEAYGLAMGLWKEGE